jgi:hypothetical protein
VPSRLVLHHGLLRARAALSVAIGLHCEMQGLASDELSAAILSMRAWHADCLEYPRMWRHLRLRRSFHGLHAVVLAALLFGCSAPGANLADWRDRITLDVEVADRASSEAQTNFSVVLKGSSAPNAATNASLVRPSMRRCSSMA